MQRLVDLDLGAEPEDGPDRVRRRPLEVAQQHVGQVPGLAGPAVADERVRARPVVPAVRQIQLKHAVGVAQEHLPLQVRVVVALERPELVPQRPLGRRLVVAVDHLANGVELGIGQVHLLLERVPVQLQHAPGVRRQAVLLGHVVGEVHGLPRLHGAVALAVDVHDLGRRAVFYERQHIKRPLLIKNRCF